MRLLTPAEQTTAYTAYRHHAGYARRAALFRHFPEPLLVVGCGFGFLVVELQRLGKQAQGIDASLYAYDCRVTDRVQQVNILSDPSHLGTFATVITEDVLPWLTDDEAIIAARNCARLAPIVIHLVTEQGQANYNYHPAGYWMHLTHQLAVSLEGM
jgi:hypothetical protein